MSYVNIPFPSFLTPLQTIVQRGGVAVLRMLPATRVAIICSKRLAHHPQIRSICDKSKRAQFSLIHPSWEGEPSVLGLQGSLQELESFSPDYIVAIGGGSVIDGAKLLWAFFEHPHFPQEKLSIPFSLPPLRKRSLFAAIPTTAGTGSEASSSAIITDSLGHKIPVVTHDFLPNLVILDSDLLQDLPDKWFCISVLDALSHSFEGYVSTLKNPLAETLIVPALKEILEGLSLYSDEGSRAIAYEACLKGAYLSGLIQNMLLVGPAHAISHQLGKSGVPHGLATGLLLPKVIRYYRHAYPDLDSKYTLLVRQLGFETLSGFLEWLETFPSQFHVPLKLSEWPGAVKPDAIGELSLSDPIARFFPEPLPAQTLQAIFESVWA